MRVLCIDGKRWAEDWGYEPLLQDGDIYTVVEKCYGWTCKGKRVEAYRLAEVDHPSAVYNIKRFVPLSEDDNGEIISEHKILENEKEASCNLI